MGRSFAKTLLKHGASALMGAAVGWLAHAVYGHNPGDEGAFAGLRGELFAAHELLRQRAAELTALQEQLTAARQRVAELERALQEAMQAAPAETVTEPAAREPAAREPAAREPAALPSASPAATPSRPRRKDAAPAPKNGKPSKAKVTAR